MSGSITLITGGCRSGKTSFAQKTAESYGGQKIYVATAAVFDQEMRSRVERHKQERAGRGWDTVEEETDLVVIAQMIRQKQHRYSAVMVDCLTMWVNNLMYQAEQEDRLLEEDEIVTETLQMVDAFSKICLPVILVTNETGLGIVPDNPLARRFRDLAGRCNREVAERAAQVILMVCGQPLTIKNS